MKNQDHFNDGKMVRFGSSASSPLIVGKRWFYVLFFSDRIVAYFVSVIQLVIQLDPSEIFNVHILMLGKTKKENKTSYLIMIWKKN